MALSASRVAPRVAPLVAPLVAPRVAPFLAPITAAASPAAPGSAQALAAGGDGLLVAALALAALALVAALAFWAGRLSAQARHAAALREAAAALSIDERLGERWRWRSDALHRLEPWRAPGRGAEGARVTLQGVPQALAERLAAERPFRDLLLELDDAPAGRRHWRLDGEPRHDAFGRFAGFDGRATPLFGAAGAEHDAAALACALDALPGPALLLLDGAGGLGVVRANAAAARRWPAHAPGRPLEPPPPALPPALAAHWRPGEAAPPGPVRAEGWGLAPLPGTPRGWLLWCSDGAEPGDATAPDDDGFAFTLSHDLRAPIRVVEGFTRIVKEDYGTQLDRVGNDHLDRVLGAAARMNLMIDALLNLSRLSQQPLKRQRVDLSQLAGYVIDELRRDAPEREAEVTIEPGLVVTGDPTLLRLVLENLLGNAWKYSARRETTRITFGRVTEGASPATAAFCVRDNGAGFDPRSAERLFGLFQRLHSASEFAGHGVGLASVRRIVRRHGGDVWAESEPDQGARFFFTLAA